MAFMLQNELFDGIKRSMHTLPFDSPLLKLFCEDRRTFWYVVKRWAWFAHQDHASEIKTADLREIERYFVSFTAWQDSDRTAPFSVFHKKSDGKQ